MVVRASYFDNYGMVESLSRLDYERNICDWVFEDDIEDEGVIFVTNRLTGCLRYVVVGEFPVMRASIPHIGEMYDCWGKDAFKRLYHHAIAHAKEELLHDSVKGLDSIEIIFESGSYAADEYMNSCGYMQRDYIKRQFIGCIRVSYGVGGYSIERG